MNAELREKLNYMISCGYTIFIFAGVVVFPVEAEDFFTPEELDEVKSCIRAEQLQNG